MRDTVAVVPADGWRAVYAREEVDAAEEDATKQLTVVPLVAFGLLLDIDSYEKQLVGMVPDGNVIVPCMSPTFVGYLSRDAQLSSMLPNLVEWRAAQAALAEQEKLEEEIRGEQAQSTSEKFSESGATGPN